MFRVKVDMVVLSFQVTDSKNHYINGLKPSDFRIYEDGILQKMSTFAEGANTPVAVNRRRHHASAAGSRKAEELPGMDKPDAFVGTNVFVLFDTSNFMYAASSTPKMRSPISCAGWTAPIRWRSTPSAAIFRAPPA